MGVVARPNVGVGVLNRMGPPLEVPGGVGDLLLREAMEERLAMMGFLSLVRKETCLGLEAAYYAFAVALRVFCLYGEDGGRRGGRTRKTPPASWTWRWTVMLSS
jgi:hypothetical protein